MPRPGLPLPAAPDVAAHAEPLARASHGPLMGIGICILRTKLMAVLLGPAGVGLMAACVALVELARALAQLGLGAACVRQIGRALADRDPHAVAHNVLVLRRASLACALAGGILFAALAVPLSELTFGGQQFAHAVAWLGLAVGFLVVTGTRSAILQGLGRTREIGSAAVAGGLAGTVACVAIVRAHGAGGVAPAIVAMAAATCLAVWWQTRRIGVRRPVFATGEFSTDVVRLLKLGAASLASGLLTLGAVYASRSIVLRTDGLAAAGMVQASWTIASAVAGLVLQPAIRGLPPRLAPVAGDARRANRLLNEQIHECLLRTVPGVLVLLVLAPVVVSALYSDAFVEATTALCWTALGTVLRVAAWPLGHLLVAQDRHRAFLMVEAAWGAAFVGLTLVGTALYRVDGAGMAFFGAYAIHFTVLAIVVRRGSGFQWSRANLLLVGAGLAAAGLVFFACDRGSLPAFTLGMLVAACAALVCLRRLARSSRVDAHFAAAHGDGA